MLNIFFWTFDLYIRFFDLTILVHQTTWRRINRQFAVCFYWACFLGCECSCGLYAIFLTYSCANLFRYNELGVFVQILLWKMSSIGTILSISNGVVKTNVTFVINNPPIPNKFFSSVDFLFLKLLWFWKPS